MRADQVPKTWAVLAGAEVLANLFDRRGIKQALWEIDEETLNELRETIGRLALAAVAPVIAAQERERCARVAHQHGYDLANLDERNGAFSAAAAIRALDDVELPKK